MDLILILFQNIVEHLSSIRIDFRRIEFNMWYSNISAIRKTHQLQVFFSVVEVITV
jgi:hypothetical protein